MMADYIWGWLVLAVFAGSCACQDMRTMSISIRTLAAGCVMVLLGTLIALVATAVSGISPEHGISVMPEAMNAFPMIQELSTVVEKAAVRTVLGCAPGAALLGLSRWTGQIGEGDGLYFMIMGAAMGLCRVTIFLLTTLFLHSAVCGIYLLISGARGMLRQRLPLLPAAGMAYILMIINFCPL